MAAGRSPLKQRSYARCGESTDPTFDAAPPRDERETAMSPFQSNLLALTRRAFLSRYAGSLGGLALSSLMAAERSARAGEAIAPLQRPTAKAVICLFQHGGPSQMDLFDPKPTLQKLHGQPYPGGELE